MQFIRNKSMEAGITAVTARLSSELASGQRVLWLLSGGSQIQPNVQIMAGISDELSQNLSISLIDERYGPVGHSDSNWTQLLAAGFTPKQATMLPVIQDGIDFSANADYFNDLLTQAFNDHDFVLGQLGIGPDGHTAGILPHSPACQSADKLAVGYEAPPLMRLTATFPALRRLHAAYVLAFGAGKLEALTNLQKDLPLEEQPAQVLKAIPEAYVYNDQVGGA